MMRVRSFFERYHKKVIQGKKRGGIPFLLKTLLHPISWVYSIGVKLRNTLYDRGLLRRYVSPVPLVISVGNIVAGGTGKTPVTLMIAGAFYEKYRLAILSRGYRSKAEKLDHPVVLCDSQGPIFPPSYCGDEPFLFAKRLPKAVVIVGRDRKQSSLLALKAGAEMIVLDDALQHRKLARDFDVIVIDVRDPFGQGYFLPRGFLRDEIRALGRADLIVLNHAGDEEQKQLVKAEIKHYTNAATVATTSTMTSIRTLMGKDVDLSTIKKAGMFCAIAHPDYFEESLRGAGFEIVDTYTKGDHFAFDDKKLAKFAQTSLKKGADCLICTEKDRVKLRDELSLALPIYWVQIDLKIIEGQDDWQLFLKKAEEKIRE